MPVPRILVVEDSRSIRTLLAMRLKNFGAEVTLANDGEMGLKKALARPFDLVLSDVDMPVMNGLKLCRELKNHPKTRGVPLILLSSMESDTDIERGFQAGASAYIVKSSPDDFLLRTIEEVLNKQAFQQNRLVMVVDDSLTILRLVESGLAKAGFQVITATNGQRALSNLEIKLPDLIICDIDMPVMNGIEFRSYIRKIPKYSSIPFVVMSANSDRATMRSMMERGVAAYMVKPFNMEQLVITVEKLLTDQFQLILKDRERLESERNLMLGSITSLVQALEARDAYTKGHSDSVSEIVAGMAKLMGFDPNEIEDIKIGALLHDIGKIGVRDNMLLKKGKLTKNEIESFRKHPVMGAEILKPIPSLNNIIPVVLHHHERIDGKGYPNQLKGSQIPLWARMTAVADTFDALTTDRSYREGFSKSIALETINDIRGSQLCEDCTDIFFKWVENQKIVQIN